MESSADVIIVGGGPAGLNCALVLARCRRKVIVFDHGRPRNRSSDGLHGFITRDGIKPAELLKIARKECKTYDVTFFDEEVIEVRKLKEGFLVKTSGEKSYTSKKICLATGLRDQLPGFANIEEYFGKSVFHCPYCDGWEHRGKPWALIAKSRAAAINNCLHFKTWTNNITLLAAYVSGLRNTDTALLERNGITICRQQVSSLEGGGGKLKSLLLKNGERLPASVLFFSSAALQSCDLADQLGCSKSNKGVLRLSRLQQTSINGVFVAGDLAREMQLAVIAAAEGARAGVAINRALNEEYDWKK